ncbi:MAG: alpha-amylase family glycosyl hydrolase [Anaerolineaceae bacterium]|jgi:cyclomaltodextrinase
MKTKNPLYPDHIFGDLEKSPKNLKYHAQRFSGVHHWDRVELVETTASVDFTVFAATESKLPVLSVQMDWSIDDWQTVNRTELKESGQKWDSISWAWQKEWKTKLTLQDEDLIRYQIYAQLADGSRQYADNNVQEASEATQFARWSTTKNLVPDWAKGARIYQIFVDRFNPGEGRRWLQTEDLCKPFGGTILGVTEKLDHIQKLGFNTIWLTPIFRSPSHHGYDISDYFEIEPRFGSKQDLRELIDQTHQRGMRLMLDFVANHCSNEHNAFLAATQSKKDPHHDWFYWKRWPKTYRCFFGVPGMPKLNLRFGSPARQHLLEAAAYWLELGVDGYRLDYANGPDRDFWVDFQRVCLKRNPQCWTFGEVVAPVEEQAQFSGSMHGTLDFLTCQILRETFALRTRPAAELASYLCASRVGFPAGFSRPAFIDNHDMNRFIFTAEEKLESLHAALRLLYLLPEAPIVYYGSEIPLSQKRSIHAKGGIGFDEGRVPMPWDQPTDTPTAALLRELAQFRQENSWLTDASWKLISTSKDGTEAQLCIESGGHELTVKIVVKEDECSVTWG